MSDLISRQWLMECVNEGWIKFDTEKDENKFMHLVRDIAPSVQLEPQWIPCSERLPEGCERVLATTAWGDVTIAERVYPPINDICWFIHNGYSNATINDVVAWMPIPEPYYPEGDDDERT